MDFIIVAFSSRTDAMRFKETAIKRGVKASILPTPKEAGVGCGLSVKIYQADVSLVKSLINIPPKLNAVGVFYVSVRGGHSFIRVVR